MTAARSIRVSQSGLEEAIKEGFSQIARSFVDDTINKSSQKDVLRAAFADFLGTYRAVKRSLKDEGGLIAGGIASPCPRLGYLEKEALLDSYSANIAANEALSLMSSKGITKTKEMKGLMRNSLDFRKYERDPLLREKLVIGELMTRYLEAANSINPGMISELTVNYFEWVIAQTAKIRDSAADPSFDSAIKSSPVIMPSNKTYSGFITGSIIEDIAEEKIKKIMAAGKKNQAARLNGEHDMQYHFLARNLPDITFDDIGGLETQKGLIYDAIRLPIERREEFREKGIEAPKGLIFYGPPGTGKTFIAKALANEMKLPFFYVSGPEFRKKYLGDGPMMVRQLFSDARALAPSIVFIDEVDACIMARDSDDGRYSMDVVNQMLAEIDGFNPLDSVKVIVATNYYHLLDGTFCDRFPSYYHVGFSLPDRDSRAKALKAMTKKMKLREIDIGSLAETTEGANFRALHFICNQAGMYSIKDRSLFIEQHHFDLSLSAYLGDPGKYDAGK
ncbi:hypothetical protein COV19_06175 [Candidatus Woesearchaeota archaeon CG10_big_fil_rev_8_21_14_0_10_44_13]|nr:MAG: hypothetical protein COV19_06175 [Candidatus Woesearchaeota archaeon CG10_big_fil_rev_8_21_14_0_10_44_13]